MQHWHWGIPVNIPKPFGASSQPLCWSQLKFNPIGLFDLRRRIGVFSSEPGVYNEHRIKFDAADLAWFAAGLSTEVYHLKRNAFPLEFSTLRQAMPSGQAGSSARSALRTRVQKLTFDLAALWDRAFGGATLVIHVEGATRPNAPRKPEYIKSDVYFPGYLIEEIPRFSPIISEIVQRYIVDIGMPVIERWEQSARSIWPMTQGTGGAIPSPYPSQPIQPDATPRGSSTFVYNGRPISSNLNGRPVNDDEFEEEEVTSDMVELLNVMEERDNYKARVEQLMAEMDNIRAVLTPQARASDGKDTLAGPPTPPSAQVVRHSSPDQFDRFGHVGVRRSTPQAISNPIFQDRSNRIGHHDHDVSLTPLSGSRRGSASAYLSPQANRVPRRLFPDAVASPSRSSELVALAPAPAGHGDSDAFAADSEYYNFLDSHNISHLRSTLDVIRHARPISSWAELLKDAGVPLDLINSIMILMAAANA